MPLLLLTAPTGDLSNVENKVVCFCLLLFILVFTCTLLTCLIAVCLSAYRQFVFAAFTKEFISAPFTEPVFHFFIPALSDVRLSFPFEAFLSSLQATFESSSVLHNQAPWVFYFVLSAGENCLGEWHSLGMWTHASVDIVYLALLKYRFLTIHRIMLWWCNADDDDGWCLKAHWQRRVSCCTFGFWRPCCLCSQYQRAAIRLKLAVTQRMKIIRLASSRLLCG